MQPENESPMLSPILQQMIPGSVVHWCPGCRMLHPICIDPDAAVKWSWNSDPVKPTFNPSVKVLSPQCHYFVREGKIQYLSDCSHKYAGQTIDMPEIPEDERW
jgi:hypothetical protein